MQDADILSQYSVVCDELKAYPQATLVAVTKTHDFRYIELLYQAGQRDFGENYIQEFLDKKAKAEAKGLHEIRWHLIGPQQTNKSKIIAYHYPIFHALDRIELGEKINTQALIAHTRVSCFVQVNIDDEESKSGFANDLFKLTESLGALSALPGLRILGLMCIPNPNLDPKQAFRQLASLAQQTGHLHEGKLSMGMSDDYQSALKLGASHVRVGSKIFGSRQ